MMGTLQILLSLLALISRSAGLALDQDVKSMESIYVENPYTSHDNDGFWGVEEHCSSGHAFAFEIKYEAGGTDQTRVNAVKFYCRDSNGGLTGDIKSLEGKNGHYMGVRSCPGLNDKMTGFRLRVWPYQGTFGDDWATDNVQILCSSNTTLDGLGDPVSQETMSADNLKFSAQSISENMEVVDIPMKSRSRIHGDWTNWAHCSTGYYICGLTTLVEESHLFEDDAGLIDMRLFCSTP